MKLVSLLLMSTVSLVSHEPTWTFEPQNRSASLQEPELQMSPLRLACSERGYLEIEILSGPSPEVTLAGPSKFLLTIRGELGAGGIGQSGVCIGRQRRVCIPHRVHNTVRAFVAWQHTICS